MTDLDLTGTVGSGLTQTEADSLAAHEATIRAGLDTFVAVGKALLAIRDGQLYRSSHATFEDYARERWSMDRTYAHRVMQSAQVVGMLPMGNTVTPTNERQVRPLGRLRDDPAAVRSAWSRATDTAEAEQKPVTAAIVEQAVRDELAERRGEIQAAQQQAEKDRAEVAEFNAATAHLVPQMEQERPWSLAAISVTRAVERLPLDVDPAELARRVPTQSAYRLDDVAKAVEWLTRLIAARQEIAS